MKVCKVFPFALLISFIGCKKPNPKVIQPKTDTARVIELALRTAFYHYNLPETYSLTLKYYFHDSILFTTRSLPLKYLPSNIDTLNFKILTREKIFSLIKSDTNVSNLPNYLCIGAFEKSDTGYFVNIQSLSCRPYGGGGTIRIYIVKNKDSFIVKNKMSTSIN